MNNPLKHPASQQIPENDVEKRGEVKDSTVNVISYTGHSPDGSSPLSGSVHVPEKHDIPPTPTLFTGRLARWNAKVEALAGLEARGITRVLPEEKHGGGAIQYLQLFILWFSIDVVVNNLVLGFLGPLVFNLGWKDSVLCVIFGNLLSCCGAAYTSTFGPESGNRTMILGRYFFGYWPSKLPCALNVILNVGWGIIASIVAGQIFSAVNGHGLTVAVGCVICALLIGLFATFGMAVLHTYERYAWIPQIVALFSLIGASAKHYNTGLQSTADSHSALIASRASFFALQFSLVIGFSAAGADYVVYYPTNTSKRLVFLMVWLGLWTALIFVNIVGVAIATGVATTKSWSDAFDVNSGALVVEALSPLGGWGKFCAVILALGGVANNAPPTYSAALSIQVLGRYAKAVPRWIWCLVLMIVELVCSVAGRNNLFQVFENFLPLMAYWSTPWVTIVFLEHMLFHKLRKVPFDWTAWEDKARLPLGGAALLSFLIGWAGAIVGMSQTWYTGPIAEKVGGFGGDIGAWLAIAFVVVSFPPLRYIELRMVGH